MIVRITRDNGRNPFKNAILSECLLERGRISINMPFAYIDVPEWTVFCNCVLRAAAACSRDYRGAYISERLIVQVELENFHNYRVGIRIDATINGLRYGSVSA